jgi:hypothetical protein
VKPCPLLQTPEHTDALSRIAQQALATYCHYRFYAYTEGAIGGDVNFAGPKFTVPDAQPDFDFSTGRWADWAAGVKWVTKPTIPGVCSSFAWQMVQNVSASNLGPKIVLDWAKTQAQALGEDNRRCVRAVAPEWQADSIGGGVRDGLYSYSEADRETTAQSLHDDLSQTVYDSLKGSLHDAGGVQKAVAAVLDDVGRAAFIAAAAAGVSAVSSLILPLLGSVVVDAVFIENLIELLYDMPEDISNQICNLFAFDCARGFPGDTRCVDAKGNEIKDVDSDNWSSAPGTGRAVSPDNIHMFWDAPGVANSEIIQGLYGYNVAANVCLGVFNKPKCALVPSTGTATLFGFVRYKNRALAGAYVTAACQFTTTPNLPDQIPYTLKVRSGGQYKVVARYEDPKTRILYGEAVTGLIVADASVRVDINVTDPPSCMRNVVVQGTIRCDDVYLTGSDDDEQAFKKKLFVQYGVPVFDIPTATWKVDTSAGRQRLTDQTSAGFSVGDSNASLNISVKINPGLDVDVTIEGLLNPGDDDMSTGTATFNVPADQTISLTEGSLDTGGPFNDRAYFRGITIANNAVTGI